MAYPDIKIAMELALCTLAKLLSIFSFLWHENSQNTTWNIGARQPKTAIKYIVVWQVLNTSTARHNIPRVYSPLDVSCAYERPNVLHINI